MVAKYELLERSDGRYYVNLKAANGQNGPAANLSDKS